MLAREIGYGQLRRKPAICLDKSGTLLFVSPGKVLVERYLSTLRLNEAVEKGRKTAQRFVYYIAQREPISTNWNRYKLIGLRAIVNIIRREKRIRSLAIPIYTPRRTSVNPRLDFWRRFAMTGRRETAKNGEKWRICYLVDWNCTVHIVQFFLFSFLFLSGFFSRFLVFERTCHDSLIYTTKEIFFRFT